MSRMLDPPSLTDLLHAERERAARRRERFRREIRRARFWRQNSTLCIFGLISVYLTVLMIADGFFGASCR